MNHKTHNGCRDGGMVDTRDLKSLDQKWLCGFESRSRHFYLTFFHNENKSIAFAVGYRIGTGIVLR